MIILGHNTRGVLNDHIRTLIRVSTGEPSEFSKKKFWIYLLAKSIFNNESGKDFYISNTIY